MRRDGVCLVGYGETPYVRAKGSHRSILAYTAEAVTLALDSAGLGKRDVRGLAFTSMMNRDDSPYVAEQLGLELDWVLRADYGGASGVMAVRRAASAIQAGEIEVAVCVGADIQEAGPLAIASYARVNYVEPFGYGGPNSLFGLVQQRHMAQYGTSVAALGRLAVAFRHNASLTDHALLKTPLTVEDYASSRLISDPVRLNDCVMPCDGGAAVVVASERVARRLTDRPVYLDADAERTNHGGGGQPDRLETGFRALREPLFSMVPRDRVDFAELYDDYPMAVLLQFEDLGFCEPGKGAAFVEAHDFTVAGDLPVNTGGGQLSRGQPGLAGGYLHVVEAVRQLRHEAGRNQVRKAETALVTGLGLLGYNVNVMCCSAMILQRRPA